MRPAIANTNDNTNTRPIAKNSALIGFKYNGKLKEKVSLYDLCCDEHYVKIPKTYGDSTIPFSSIKSSSVNATSIGSNKSNLSLALVPSINKGNREYSIFPSKYSTSPSLNLGARVLKVLNTGPKLI